MYDLTSEIQEVNAEKIILPLKDAIIEYYPNFYTPNQADRYFSKLLEHTPWQQDNIKVFGRVYPQPRLTALYGVTDQTYSYSGITMHPIPFEEIHFEIAKAIQSKNTEPFTTVLLNLYRDGNDSNGWHSDDEKELGINPVIASLSLGAKRYFHLKHKKDKELRYKLSLAHGSLLIMKGATQHHWQHQLPKTKKINAPRINLTFRTIHELP